MCCNLAHLHVSSLSLSRTHKDSLPVLGVPGEVVMSAVPLGFVEVAGSDLVLRANLEK